MLSFGICDNLHRFSTLTLIFYVTKKKFSNNKNKNRIFQTQLSFDGGFWIFFTMSELFEAPKIKNWFFSIRLLFLLFDCSDWKKFWLSSFKAIFGVEVSVQILTSEERYFSIWSEDLSGWSRTQFHQKWVNILTIHVTKIPYFHGYNAHTLITRTPSFGVKNRQKWL